MIFREIESWSFRESREGEMNLDKFNKFEGEKDISFIVRVCGLKDEYGLTWKQLAQEINRVLGLDYDESAYRKKYQYYKSVCEAKDEDVAKDQDILDELEEKRLSLKKEIYKLQALRKDDNKRIREQARNDLYFEEVVRAIEDNKNIKRRDFGDVCELCIQKKDTAYLLSFADVHYGKEFDSITNFYSPETAKMRMDELLKEVVLAVSENRISELNVCALGDLIEGMTLRVSQLQSLKLGLVDQTIQFASYMIDWLGELSKYVKINYYSVMSSNHSQIRPFGSKPNEFVNEDMERVIFAMLQRAFEGNERVNVVESQDKFTTLELLGYKIVLLHGHEVKEIKTVLQDLSWKYKTFFDYAITAHLHHYGTIVAGEGRYGNCEVIQCPSIMGSDEYADQLMVGSKPGALLIKFTSKQGKRSVEEIIL